MMREEIDNLTLLIAASVGGFGSVLLIFIIRWFYTGLWL